jgi:hypothetical protein
MGNILTSDQTDPARASNLLYKPGDIMLRKTIHDILVNKTDTANGTIVYTNQMKTYCKTIASEKKGDNFTNIGPQKTFTGTNLINVALPNVINTMQLSTISPQVIKNHVTKTDVTMNITTSNDQDIIAQATQNTIEEANFNCDTYIYDQCAKQIYRNDCFTLVNNTWVWNYTNSRCVIDDPKTMTPIKFNTGEDNTTAGLNFNHKKIVINSANTPEFNYMFMFIDNDELNNILTPEYWVSNTLTYKYINTNFGFFPFTLDELIELTTTASPLFSGGSTIDILIRGLKNALYVNYLYQYEVIYKQNTNLSKVFNYGDTTCACVNSTSGPNLLTYPSNKCMLYTDNTRLTPLDIQSLLDFISYHDIYRWGNSTLLSNGNVSYDGNYQQIILTPAILFKYNAIIVTAGISTASLAASQWNPDWQINGNMYNKIQTTFGFLPWDITYLYNNRGTLYIPTDTDPVKAVGSTITLNQMLILNYLYLNSLRLDEIQSCLGYYYYDNTGLLVKPSGFNYYDGSTPPELVQSLNYTPNMPLYDRSMNFIPGSDTTDLKLGQISTFTSTYGPTRGQGSADTYFNLKKEAGISTKRGVSNVNTGPIGSIFSIKLGNSTQNNDTKINNTTTNKTGTGTNMAYPNDAQCALLIDNTTMSELPYFNQQNITPPSVTCVNQINISNSVARDINFSGNLIMNNTCGNTGNVSQTFYPSGATIQDNTYCALTNSTNYILLSNFNINVNTNTTQQYNTLFSQFNGAYLSCKSPLMLQFNIPYCAGISGNSANTFIKHSNPSIFLQFIQDPSQLGYIMNINMILGGVVTTVFVSKMFLYQSNNPSDGQEMCMDNNFLSTYIFNDTNNSYIQELTQNITDPIQKKTVIDTATSDYISRNTLSSIPLKNIPAYNWLFDVNIFNTLTNTGANMSQVTSSGNISRSSNDGTTSSGTKFLLGKNLNEYYVQCSDSAQSTWGCGKFMEDVDNMNSFMILNNRDYNYNNYSGNTYQDCMSNGYYDITKIVSYVNKSKIVYSPAIYRYLLISTVGPASTIIAASYMTNEVIGLGTSNTLSAANLAIAFPNNKLDMVNQDILIGQFTNLAVGSSTTGLMWTVYNKQQFTNLLGNVEKNNIMNIILQLDTLSVKLARNMLTNPYKFIDTTKESKMVLQYTNNVWQIINNNVIFFQGPLFNSDFVNAKNYWSKIISNGNTFSTVNIETFSQYNVQIQIDNSKLPADADISLDISNVFLNSRYFNNPAINLSNLSINVFNDTTQPSTYILLQFGINDINKVLTQQREFGYLINYLIMNIPYLFDYKTNTNFINSLTNAIEFHKTGSNMSSFNFGNNVDKTSSGYLLNNFLVFYNVDSFLLTIDMNFNKGVTSSVINNVNFSLSPQQISLMEQYLNTVVYNTFYSVPEFNMNGPVIVKCIDSSIQTNIISGANTKVRFYFKVYYLYYTTDSIVLSIKNKLIDSIVNINIKNLVQYPSVFQLNVQTVNTPVSDFINLLNIQLNNTIVPQSITSLNQLFSTYKVTTIFQTLSITSLMNMISPLVLPPTTDSAVVPTTSGLSSTEHNNWSIVLFDQATQSDMLKLIPLTPSQKILNQFTNLFNMIITNTAELNQMRDKCSATPAISQTVINSINTLINESFLSTSITQLEIKLVNYLSNYYPASANVDILLTNAFNKLLTKTAPVTFNTKSPAALATYIEKALLNSIAPMLAIDMTSNIFTISTNNKYLYKTYIALLNNTFTLYNNVYTQLVARIQQVNITFISSINANTLLADKITRNQKSYGSCMELNTCLSNATELSQLIQLLNVAVTTRSINPNTGLPSSDLQSTDLPSSDLQSTDLPSSDLQSTDLQSTDLLNKAQSGLLNKAQSGLPNTSDLSNKPQSGSVSTTTMPTAKSNNMIIIIVIIIIIIIVVVVLGGKKRAAIN